MLAACRHAVQQQHVTKCMDKETKKLVAVLQNRWQQQVR